MSLAGRKIWIDIEEPKTGVMFRSLIKMIQNENAELLITARDFDSNFKVLDSIGIKYRKVGKHGGSLLENKLETYIDRLKELFLIIKEFKPDFFITFSSVEGPRISFGLRIPSIGFNDEPRNEAVCKLIFPFLDEIITPNCVPIKLYEDLYAKPGKLIRYNGIDEIGWLDEYKPNPKNLGKLNLEKGKYVIIRSEMSTASYFINTLKAEETIISKFLPKIYENFPDLKYLVILRSKEQEKWLKQQLKDNSNVSNIIITQFTSNLVDLCFYSSLVISGGGTIVRESCLLGVPSIEFFPGETAPQEHFLIDNGFPLEHIREPEKIIEKSIDIIKNQDYSKRFNLDFKEKIEHFENPNKICFNRLKERLKIIDNN